MKKILTADCKKCPLHVENYCDWGKSKRKKILVPGPNSKKLKCNLKGR